MMGSSLTSDVTKGSRALLCMLPPFWWHVQSREFSFSSGHDARGLTCSRIVETGIYIEVGW